MQLWDMCMSYDYRYIIDSINIILRLNSDKNMNVQSEEQWDQYFDLSEEHREEQIDQSCDLSEEHQDQSSDLSEEQWDQYFDLSEEHREEQIDQSSDLSEEHREEQIDQSCDLSEEHQDEHRDQSCDLSEEHQDEQIDQTEQHREEQIDQSSDQAERHREQCERLREKFLESQHNEDQMKDLESSVLARYRGFKNLPQKAFKIKLDKSTMEGLSDPDKFKMYFMSNDVDEKKLTDRIDKIRSSTDEKDRSKFRYMIYLMPIICIIVLIWYSVKNLIN